MSAPRNATVEKPDRGDLEQAIHGLSGIFGALDQIKNGSLNGVFDDRQLTNMEHSLVIAGRLITEDYLRRF